MGPRGASAPKKTAPPGDDLRGLRASPTGERADVRHDPDVDERVDFERCADDVPASTGGTTVPLDEVSAVRSEDTGMSPSPRSRTAWDGDDRPSDPRGDRPVRQRWQTPAALYRLISTPVLRAVLGWDLARRDVRWVPVRSHTVCIEVGSNGGFYTGALARHLRGSGTLIAMEPHRGSLEALRRRHADGWGATICPVAGDGTRLPFDASSVDVVFLGYCLEEMPDPHRAVSEAYRVLRPGGRLVMFLWRPAITRRRREPVVDRLRELFEVERERFGPQNIRLRYRRPDPGHPRSGDSHGPPADGPRRS